MNKFLCVAAVAAFGMFGAQGAFAQSATQNVVLSATVPGYCNIGGLTSAPDAAATIPIVNGMPVTTSPISAGALGNVACNENTTLTLTSANTGLTTTSAAATGFSNKIDYQATANYGTFSQMLDTSVGPTITSAATTTGALGSQTFTVNVTPKSPANTLVQGAYGDTLSVLFTPSP